MAPKTAVLGLGLIAGALAVSGCRGGGAGGAASSSSGALATVNGETISREEFLSALEAKDGPETAVSLLDYHLVLELAKSKGVAVTEDELSQAIADRQARLPAMAQIIAAGGPRLEDLKRQIRQELTSIKIITSEVKVTDADVKKFFANYHADWYDQPVKVQFGALFTSTKTRADLMASQLKSKSKSFQELLVEQGKANDPVARNSGPSNPQPTRLSSLPPALRSQLANAKVGDTTAPVQVQPGMFGIFKLVKAVPAVTPQLATMLPEVETDCKLAVIAKRLNDSNPKNPPFKDALQRIAGLIMQRQGGGEVALRDVLAYIDQTSINQIVASQRASGLVKISDPNYQMLTQVYPDAGAGALGGAAPAGAPGAAGAPSAPAGAAPAAPAGAPVPVKP